MSKKHWVLMVIVIGAQLAAQDKPKEQPAEKPELSAAEKFILEATNEERAKAKLPPLKANPILFRVARAHSANMAKQEKLAHELDGKRPHERTREAGYKGNFIGENCAAGERFPPREAMKGWMESKPHRENILNPNYTEIGVGIARSASGEEYYTQVFGRPAQ